MTTIMSSYDITYSNNKLSVNEFFRIKIFELIKDGLNNLERQIYEYDIQVIENKNVLIKIEQTNYLLLNKLNIKDFYFYCRQKILLSKIDYKLDEIDCYSLCILLINPNFSTGWNIRKKILIDNLNNLASSDLISKELNYNSLILKKNFKCEQAFMHRRWLIKLGIKKQTNENKNLNSLELNNKHLIEFLYNEFDFMIELSKKIKQNYYSWTYFNWLFYYILHLIKDKSYQLEKSHLQGLFNEYLLKENIPIVYQNPSDFSVFHSRLYLYKLMFENINLISLEKPYNYFLEELSLVDDLIVRYAYNETIWNYRKYFLMILKHNLIKVTDDDKKNFFKDSFNLNLKIKKNASIFFSIDQNNLTNEILSDYFVDNSTNFINILLYRERKVTQFIKNLYELYKNEYFILVLKYSNDFVKFLEKFLNS